MGDISHIDVPGPDWKTRFLCSSSGNPKACAYNARLILENDPAWVGVLAWCEFSQRIVKLKAPPLANASRGEWDDADDSNLRFWVAENYGVEVRKSDIADAVMGAARCRLHHPVREYLDGLVWDGTERLCTWVMEYLRAGQDDDRPEQSDRALAARDRYYSLIGRLWMIQSVARIRQPGCKADNVLILEGAQGRRKSTALKVLYGDAFFSDTPIDLSSKDAMEMIRGLWCIEMAELDALNKSDARRAKAFFSSGTDRFRLPYGHRSTRFARQVVMAGTTNQHEYLRDSTGNRRFMPVDCGDVDIDGLREARDQLWAEADYLFRHGSIWWAESPDDKALLEEEQSGRVDADVWEPLIQQWLTDRLLMTHPGSRATLFVTAADIMSEALGMDIHAMRRPEQTRVGAVVHALGWRPTRPTIDGKRMRGYQPGRRLLDSTDAKISNLAQNESDDLPQF